MTTTDIHELLDTYSPDHYPAVSCDYQNSIIQFSIHLDSYSIIKFIPDYYDGHYEVYNPKTLEDIYRAPTLADIVDYLISIDPSLLYSPILSPERFL